MDASNSKANEVGCEELLLDSDDDEILLQALDEEDSSIDNGQAGKLITFHYHSRIRNKRKLFRKDTWQGSGTQQLIRNSFYSNIELTVSCQYTKIFQMLKRLKKLSF